MIKNKPSVFTALLVLELSKKFEAKLERDVIFDFIVEKLLADDEGTGLPLIVIAAIHATGHMFVIDVLTLAAGLSSEVKNKVLAAFGEHVDVMVVNKFGSKVLLSLKSVL